jgi:hypothetical protein
MHLHARLGNLVRDGHPLALQECERVGDGKRRGVNDRAQRRSLPVIATGHQRNVVAVVLVLACMGLLDLSKFALMYIADYWHWLEVWWAAF